MNIKMEMNINMKRKMDIEMKMNVDTDTDMNMVTDMVKVTAIDTDMDTTLGKDIEFRKHMSCHDISIRTFA